MPYTQIEMSMGQAVEYNGAYKEFIDEEKIQNYKKVEPYLSIYSDEKELEELKIQVAEQEEQLKEQQEFMEEVRSFMETFPDFKEIMHLYKQKKEKIQEALEEER